MPPELPHLPRPRLPLETPRLQLRVARGSDASPLVAALGDREVTRTVPLWPHYTRQDSRAYIARSRASVRSGSAYPLVITLAGAPEHPIGTVGLEVRSPRDRRGHLGYWVARPYWGQGIATEAAFRLCREAFRTVRLHRLETAVVVGNARSRAVLAKLGFRSEGVDRENFLIDGRYRDAERFGLLASDFRDRDPTLGRPPVRLPEPAKA